MNNFFFFVFSAQFVAASGVKGINQHTLRANNIQGGGTPIQVLGIQRPRGITTTPVSTKQLNARGIVTPQQQQQHRHMINAAGALRIATPTGL